ncbi:MAG: RIP metalloprotease RseP [Synergistaceae bacterium]|nr:RIP metalloprotease RseP [Synergistaceae bacterium]
MISIISFLIVIGICVISHEGGHFIAAKWRDVFVHEFSFGMGPSLWSKTRGETLWSFRAFPIGGFVRLEGEDASDSEDQKKKSIDPSRSLSAKKPWERLVIIAAGAFVNIMLAWLLTTAYLTGYGIYDLEKPVIGTIMDKTPAQAAGLQSGDRISSINGIKLEKWSDIRKIIQDNKITGDRFNITVVRGGKEINYTVDIPLSKKQGGRFLGIQPALIRYPLSEALTKAFSYSWQMGVEILRGLWMILTMQIRSDVIGPVGIAIIAGDAFKQGFWSFIAFLGVINLNLGLLNLLPFPALDGGRLVFILIEMITGKNVPEKWETRVHYAGFIILITLIILVTGKDIIRLFH